jgi:hypothetical protein
MNQDALPSSQARSASFTASDVKEAAGLSYRQLNDWESKGALASNREGKAGWRKFSRREVFALMVCGEIRRRFGVSVESLRWIKDFMLQEGADHFRYAVETIGNYGFAVWLLTDLKETFVMDNDLELEDMLHHGYFRAEDSNGFILLQVNPLVNRLLQCHKPPIKLPIHDQSYAKLRAVKVAEMPATLAENFRLVRKSTAKQKPKSSRHGKPESRSTAAVTKRAVGLRHNPATVNRP